MRRRNIEKQFLKTSGNNLKTGEIIVYPRVISLPVLSKAERHNYFADKMAMFSVIIGYVCYRIQHAHFAEPFVALYDKLATMRRDFLLNYHYHSAEAKSNKARNPLKLIIQFEEKVISEILNFGIMPREVADFNAKNLELVANKSES